MKLFNSSNDIQEQEVSSGAVIGYVLIGCAAVILVAFIAFVIVTNINSKNDKSEPAVTESQISTEINSSN